MTQQTDQSPESPRPVVLQSADRLRAAAHPTRMRLIKTLTWMGPARTSDLADELNAPHNSISYHLRELKRAGYITRTPGEDKRESWWTLASPAGISFEMTDDLKAPALDLLRIDYQLNAELVAHSEELNRDGKWPTLSAEFGLSLTESELSEVYDRLRSTVDDLYQRAQRPRSAVEPIYYLTVGFFPTRLPE